MPLFDESRVRAVLLDIEGTTTPIDFVTTTLFPYASRKLASFLCQHASNAEIRALMGELRAQRDLDEQNGFEPPGWDDDSEAGQVRCAAAYGQWLMARDSKSTPLKTLQGEIWQQGYSRGELKGEVYPDVPVAFERWKRQGKIICIYSSGSVLAQQLLFGTVATGDLTRYITAFCDTRMGAKTDAESYRKIAASVAEEPEQFLFLSDAAKEIAAARAGGMQALLCERGARLSQEEGTARLIRDFNQVFPD